MPATKTKYHPGRMTQEIFDAIHAEMGELILQCYLERMDDNSFDLLWDHEFLMKSRFEKAFPHYEFVKINRRPFGFRFNAMGINYNIEARKNGDYLRFKLSISL